MLIYLQMMDSEEDREKFEQIYLHYRGLMAHAAYQLLHNWEDAEDAVHQAFEYIAQNMHKISDPYCTKTRSYLVIIVESKSLDLLRQRKRRPTQELNEATVSLPAPLSESRGVAAAIARLEGRQREVILLKYAYGYTNDECAEIFGLSYDGVHSLDQRAKVKLRELLREEGIEL